MRYSGIDTCVCTLEQYPAITFPIRFTTSLVYQSQALQVKEFEMESEFEIVF